MGLSRRSILRMQIVCAQIRVQILGNRLLLLDLEADLEAVYLRRNQSINEDDYYSSGTALVIMLSL